MEVLPPVHAVPSNQRTVREPDFDLDADKLVSQFYSLLSPQAAVTLAKPAPLVKEEELDAFSSASSSATHLSALIPEMPIASISSSSTVCQSPSQDRLPFLHTIPATPTHSPFKVTFTLDPEVHETTNEEPGCLFTDEPQTIERSISMRLPSTSTSNSGSDTLTPNSLKKRTRSLPAFPKETDIDAADLVRQMSEAALDESFGSALRLNAHRITLKMEQRYRALLELVETERDYVEDLRIFIQVYLKNLSILSSLDECGRETITRTAQAIYELHQNLLSDLEAIETEVRWHHQAVAGSVAHDVKVLTGMQRISELLLKRSSEFSIYEDFCSRHSEAAGLLRKAEEDQVEWDGYLAHCLEGFDHIDAISLKLEVQDFAIKPVQRICKYPLILKQLCSLVSERIPSEVNAAVSVQAAYEAMRIVTKQVDEARRRFAAEQRSARIAVRLELPSISQPTFTNILGQTSLVGALYFVEPATAEQSLKAKYYGAILYESHILILKIKKQDLYEPRHWWPLRVLDLEVESDDDSLLSHSFRLKYQQYVFELGAANDAEKALWCHKLSAAITRRRNSWSMCDPSGLANAGLDDVDISSIPVDKEALHHSLTDTSDASRSSKPLPPLPPSSVNRRMRITQTANSFLGRTPSAARAMIDLRLADVMSEECCTARLVADHDAEAARVKFRSSRSRSEGRSRPQSMSVTFSRASTLRENLRRRSFVNDKASLTHFHRRRPSADVVVQPTEDAVDAFAQSEAFPHSSINSGGLSSRHDSLDNGGRKRWSLKGRSLSYKSFIDTPLAQDASVGRHNSSSSAGSSSVAFASSPASTAPSSPLMTPQDLPSTSGFGNLISNLSRRKSSSSIFKNTFGPSLGCPEQDALAHSASEFLYSSPDSDRPGWKGVLRPKWGSSSSLPAIHARANSANSFFGFFVPPSSSQSQSSAKVAHHNHLSTILSQDEDSLSTSTQLGLPTSEKRKRNMFLNLTRMTSLSSDES